MDLTRVDLRLAVGEPVGNLPVKIRCREGGHRDTEQSMAVYRGYVRCYGCGKVVARRMEALAYLLYGDEWRWSEAVRAAENYTGRQQKEERRVVVTDPLPNSLAVVYNRFLEDGGRAHRLEWLYERCLTDTTISRFCLGHDGTRFTLPVFDSNGGLATIRFRRDDYYWDGEDYPKYSGIPGRNGSCVYPAWLIQRDRPTVLYVWEGEFDTVLSWQLGYPAVTVTNGAGSLAGLSRTLSMRCPWVTHLVIGGDMDLAGRAATETTAISALAGGFTVSRVCWPVEEGKDLTELVQQGNWREERMVGG